VAKEGLLKKRVKKKTIKLKRMKKRKKVAGWWRRGGGEGENQLQKNRSGTYVLTKVTGRKGSPWERILASKVWKNVAACEDRSNVGGVGSGERGGGGVTRKMGKLKQVQGNSMTKRNLEWKTSTESEGGCARFGDPGEGRIGNFTAGSPNRSALLRI